MKVKVSNIIAIIASSILLTACPSDNYRSSIKAIQDNNMDFPDQRTVSYKGIKFELSGLFSNMYASDIIISDDASLHWIPEMQLYFTVERFGIYDGHEFSREIPSDEMSLDRVHDAYIGQRASTLQESSVAIKKAVPKSVEYTGIVQVLSGVQSEYEDPASYFVATLEKEDQFYVFHLIGKKENMGYLYDDFIDILSSVK